MSSVLSLLRGLLHRAGTTAVILLVALCATAAAAVGPTYYTAATHSILQDTVASGGVVGRGYEAVEQGAAVGTVDSLRATVDQQVQASVGSRATADRLFADTIESVETTRFFPQHAENVPLVWRTGVCAHLRLQSGRCPTATNDVIISTSLAADTGLRLGDVAMPATGPHLRVSGIYVPPNATLDYWFARGNVYFPGEITASSPDHASAQPFDAMFTSLATINGLRGNPQGTVVVSQLLDPARVQPADVDVLARLATSLSTAAVFAGQVAIVTGLSSTVSAVHASWTALAVPVVVVTAELLVLTWLLLFLVVTDAVEARGTEIALAKLRGYGAARAIVFGLGEIVTLLVVALPVGTVLGWLLSRGLARVLLRDGTPVGLPGLGWAAAAVATVGGAAAVVAAARNTLRRPVVEQWRRTGRRATDRGWIFDAVVLTGAVAGLVQLGVAGTLDSARSSSLALLVPGLLGLAVAVLGSRLLPLICRAAFGRTRRSGTLGPFLAVRHIARRPGGTRTTMILATAVALATFSMASWSTGAANRTRVAQVTVGAPTVLTVAPKQGVDLSRTVDRIDPTGHAATAVETFDSGQSVLLAVEPRRFAAVADWSAASVGEPARLLSGLHPAAPPPIVVTGQRLRFHVRIDRMNPATVALSADVVAAGATAPTPVDLGNVSAHASVVRVGSLAGCPCTVRDLQVAATESGPVQVKGTVTLQGVDVGTPGGWRPVPGVTAPARWIDSDDQAVALRAGAHGLTWSFFAPPRTLPTLRTHDRPEPLPAAASSSLAGGSTVANVSGLNGADLPLAILATTHTIPSAPAKTAIVDITYADRAAFGYVGPSTAQVWVRGPVDRIRRALAAAGVPVVGERTSAAVDDAFSRQGPGLASVLFLADAAASAVLAALAAMLSLAAAARRRRYEYAALGATGATPRSLYAALAIEQLVVVGFGALLGVGSGLAAFALAGGSVPEFVQAPTAVLLRDRPSVLLLAGVLGAAFVVLLGTALLAAAVLLRSVSPDQLREAPG